VAASGVAVIGFAGPASAAVVNLGLDIQGAKRIQRWILTMYGYTGAIDGWLGTNSWKAMQRYLATWPGQPSPYTGAIDGIVGPATIVSLQANLMRRWRIDASQNNLAARCAALGVSSWPDEAQWRELAAGDRLTELSALDVAAGEVVVDLPMPSICYLEFSPT